MAEENDDADAGVIGDDQLRLIFTCCHPALATEAQVSLTLRTVCGLTTEEIAAAFLVPVPTIAQRIVRAKARIRELGIRYEVPDAHELPQRLEAVLGTIYLVFNEGYAARAGGELVRVGLTAEATRLGRLLVDLLPDPEALGLLGLMLLQDSRRAARVDADGALVLLADQDRSLWDRQAIAQGQAFVRRAFETGEVGPYAIQGAIAAIHARALDAAATDWPAIVALYDLLVEADDGPVTRLNRAVAVGMASGPETGIALIRDLMGHKALADYHLAHAALADLHLRHGDKNAAKAAYEAALARCREETQRAFILSRLAGLSV